MDRPRKPLAFRNASCFIKSMTLWISVSIASLGAASAVLCLTIDTNRSIITMASAIAANSMLPAEALDSTSVDDYQPPDNGGPGKTGGAGTRWQ